MYSPWNQQELNAMLGNAESGNSANVSSEKMMASNSKGSPQAYIE
jgi:hypothetical protein